MVSLCQGSRLAAVKPASVRCAGVNTRRTPKPIYNSGLAQLNIFSRGKAHNTTFDGINRRKISLQASRPAVAAVICRIGQDFYKTFDLTILFRHHVLVFIQLYSPSQHGSITVINRNKKLINTSKHNIRKILQTIELKLHDQCLT